MAFAVQVQEGRAPQTAWRTVLLGLAPPRIYFGAWPAGRECEKSRAVRRGRGHLSRRWGGAVRATSGWARPSPSRLVAPEPVVPPALYVAAHVCKLLCEELQSRSLCPGARGKEVSVGTGAQAGPPTSGCPGRRPRPCMLASARVTCRPHSSPVKRVGTSSCGSQDMLPCGPLPLLPWCRSVLGIHGLGL